MSTQKQKNGTLEQRNDEAERVRREQAGETIETSQEKVTREKRERIEGRL